MFIMDDALLFQIESRPDFLPITLSLFGMYIFAKESPLYVHIHTYIITYKGLYHATVFTRLPTMHALIIVQVII